MKQNLEKIYDSSKCCGCAACVNICPVDAIEMVKREGFLYPRVDKKKCIGCEQCISVCDACNKDEPQFSFFNPKQIYTFSYRDQQVLNRSSSGGFFYWISSYVISKGGIVCSPAFDAEWHVYHIFVDKKEDISKIQGSKYVQSNKEKIFRQIKKYLKAGRVVLFGGTPCEVAALKNTIGANQYNNLLCCEVICRAGNSPELFDMFVKHIQRKYGEIDYVNFREKTYGYMSVRRHIVGGANRTLFSVDLPPRLCRTGTCRRLQTG